MNANLIAHHYLTAAYWTGEGLSSTPGATWSADSEREALADVTGFITQAGALLDGMGASAIGYDFWLTRNGHGVGFWDRGLGERGDKLSSIAKGMGPKEVYVGDDGKIYFS